MSIQGNGERRGAGEAEPIDRQCSQTPRRDSVLSKQSLSRQGSTQRSPGSSLSRQWTQRSLGSEGDKDSLDSPARRKGSLACNGAAPPADASVPETLATPGLLVKQLSSLSSMSRGSAYKPKPPTPPNILERQLCVHGETDAVRLADAIMRRPSSDYIEALRRTSLDETVKPRSERRVRLADSPMSGVLTRQATRELRNAATQRSGASELSLPTISRRALSARDPLSGESKHSRGSSRLPTPSRASRTASRPQTPSWRDEGETFDQQLSLDVASRLAGKKKSRRVKPNLETADGVLQALAADEFRPGLRHRYEVTAESFKYAPASRWAEWPWQPKPTAPSPPKYKRKKRQTLEAPLACFTPFVKGEVTDKAIPLAWERAPERHHIDVIDGYELETAEYSYLGILEAFKPVYKGPETFHKLTDLAPESEVRARVRAFNSKGTGPWSFVFMERTKALRQMEKIEHAEIPDAWRRIDVTDLLADMEKMHLKDAQSNWNQLVEAMHEHAAPIKLAFCYYKLYGMSQSVKAEGVPDTLSMTQFNNFGKASGIMRKTVSGGGASGCGPADFNVVFTRAVRPNEGVLGGMLAQKNYKNGAGLKWSENVPGHRTRNNSWDQLQAARKASIVAKALIRTNGAADDPTDENAGPYVPEPASSRRASRNTVMAAGSEPDASIHRASWTRGHAPPEEEARTSAGASGNGESLGAAVRRASRELELPSSASASSAADASQRKVAPLTAAVTAAVEQKAGEEVKRRAMQQHQFVGALVRLGHRKFPKAASLGDALSGLIHSFVNQHVFEDLCLLKDGFTDVVHGKPTQAVLRQHHDALRKAFDFYAAQDMSSVDAKGALDTINVTEMTEMCEDAGIFDAETGPYSFRDMVTAFVKVNIDDEIYEAREDDEDNDASELSYEEFKEIIFRMFFTKYWRPHQLAAGKRAEDWEGVEQAFEGWLADYFIPATKMAMKKRQFMARGRKRSIPHVQEHKPK